ncbi:MAG: hypothetical protein V1781_09440 [Bacteroidota bacterium]
MIERKYNFKDVEMLISAKTLCDNFKAYKSPIIALRANWADPFITNFQTRIDTAISVYLGLDPKKDLKLATQQILQIQAQTLSNLSLFKTNIVADYATDKIRLKWLLDTLGFTDNYKDSLKKDQEALVELLQKFKLNMTTAIKTEISAKGTSTTLITDIINSADIIKNADVYQEGLKGASKELTNQAITEFNAIYAQATAICKIAAKLFKSDLVKKDKFTFAKLTSDLNAGAKSVKAKTTNTKQNP